MTMEATQFQSTLQTTIVNPIEHLAQAHDGMELANVVPVMHIEQIKPKLQLVIETTSGAQYVIDLDDDDARLNETETNRLRELLEKTQGQSRNIHDEMNPSKGQPTEEAKELAKLIRIALGGAPLSFERGDKVFVTDGSFLQNYKVNNALRDQATRGLIPAERLLTDIQYNSAYYALAFTRHILQKQLEKIQTDELRLTNPPHIKSKLEWRRKQLEKEIEFFNVSNPTNLTIKENAILTAAAFLPLDLRGKSKVEAKTALDDRAEEIKALLDGQVIHSTFGPSNGDTTNYEDRKDREGWIPFIPVGCSHTSIYNDARQKFASDIAHETAARPQIASAEAFFIEISRLVAGGANQAAIENAITGENSNFVNAFQILSKEDQDDLRERFVDAVPRFLEISGAVEQHILDMSRNDPNMTNETIRRATDTKYRELMTTAGSLLNP